MLIKDVLYTVQGVMPLLEWSCRSTDQLDMGIHITINTRVNTIALPVCFKMLFPDQSVISEACIPS